MALFKPYMGNRTSLDAVEKHAGHVYLCVDDGSFHLDFVDSEGNLQRKQINADEANKLVGYDIATVLHPSDAEIPTSQAVASGLDEVKRQIVCSDWDQNDSTVTDYIKNRTHWVEKTVTELTSETSVAGTSPVEFDSFGTLFESVGDSNPLTVVWDGITYNVYYQFYEPSRREFIQYFGNGSLISSDIENTGEPFCFADVMTEELSGNYIYFSDNSSHTFSTSMSSGETVHQLDEKYIPDTIARVTELHTVAHTGSWDDLTDKPFGLTYETGSVILAEEQTVAYQNMTSNYQWFVQPSGAIDEFVDGEEYVVTINGTSYTCVANSNGELWPAISGFNGAVSVRAGAEFYIVRDDSMMAIPKTTTISISQANGQKEIVVTLDEKYIPDTIARVEDIPEGFSGSWNDLTDRPFYKKPGEYITIIEEQTVTNGSTITGEALRTGKTYIMTVNGVDYTCKSSYLIESGSTYISISDPYVMVESNSGLTVTTSEDSVVLSVKIQGEDTIVPIPDEYLPSTVVKSVDGVLPNSSGMVRLLESQSFYIDRDYSGTSMRDILNKLSIESYRYKGYVYNDLPEDSNAYQGLIVYADTYGGSDYTHRFILLNRLGGLKVFLVDTDADTININNGIGAVEIQSDSASISDVNAAIAANKPKLATVSLPAANWTGDANPYFQVVTISGVTANSKIDLQPTAVQIVELQNADIMLMVENNDGVTTVYAIGGIPTEDYTMQALITEVMLV